jgi:hypothetical protein
LNFVGCETLILHIKAKPVPTPYFEILKRKIGIPSVAEINRVTILALKCKIGVNDELSKCPRASILV